MINILLIEDNPDHVVLIKSALAEAQIVCDLNVHHSLTGGLLALATSPVDLVLLDLYLTDSTPKETVSRARQVCSTTPVIIISSYSDSALACMALDFGYVAYLSKSFNNELPALLRSTISTALRSYKRDMVAVLRTVATVVVNPIFTSK